MEVAYILEQDSGHLNIIHTIEKPEEPNLFLLKLDIIPIHMPAYSAKDFSTVRKGKIIFYLRMIEERVFLGIKEVFSFNEKVGNVVFRSGIEA